MVNIVDMIPWLSMAHSGLCVYNARSALGAVIVELTYTCTGFLSPTHQMDISRWVDTHNRMLLALSDSEVIMEELAESLVETMEPFTE